VCISRGTSKEKKSIREPKRIRLLKSRCDLQSQDRDCGRHEWDTGVMNETSKNQKNMIKVPVKKPKQNKLYFRNNVLPFSDQQRLQDWDSTTLRENWQLAGPQDKKNYLQEIVDTRDIAPHWRLLCPTLFVFLFSPIRLLFESPCLKPLPTCIILMSNNSSSSSHLLSGEGETVWKRETLR